MLLTEKKRQQDILHCAGRRARVQAEQHKIGTVSFSFFSLHRCSFFFLIFLCTTATTPHCYYFYYYSEHALVSTRNGMNRLTKKKKKSLSIHTLISLECLAVNIKCDFLVCLSMRGEHTLEIVRRK